MTTRIASDGPGSGVTATFTAPRVTPTPARPFRQVMAASAQLVLGGAEAAIHRLPGGPVLAAAIRPGAGGEARLLGPSAEGPASPEPAPAAAGSSADALLSRNADQNLYYLRLQEQISAESRSYTALSNVLKARHDTIKNAIGNIR
jgi:hypothetical protein